MIISPVRILEKWYYLFPLLFALYPVLFLYSYNAQELLPGQLVIPVAAALGLTLICWVLLSLLVRDAIRAGIAVSILIVFFFLYGPLFDWLTVLDLFPVKHRYLIPVIVTAAGYSAWFISRLGNPEVIRNAARVLTVVIAFLLIINILSLVPVELKKAELSRSPGQSDGIRNSVSSGVNSSGDYPDIWYIILDEYASPAVIRNVWGYDNSGFTESLEQKGFFIAQNSTTRYHVTFYSLYTSLNMQYPGGPVSHAEFNNLIKNWSESRYSNKTTLEIYNAVNHNNVSAYLKGRGYTRVVMDSSSAEDPAQGSMDADVFIEYTPEKQVYLFDEFQMLLIKNSLLRPLEYTDLSSAGNVYDHIDLHRNSNLYLFSEIKNVSRMKGPKFVFVHFMMPHAPFVFDRNGEAVDKANAYTWGNKKYYLDQYIYTTRRVIESVDDILKYSERPPIIIIQSDHGVRIKSGPSANDKLDLPVDDMFRIFNAYYFPGGEQQYLYDSITPVNTFRFVLNRTFQENITLVEEA